MKRGDDVFLFTLVDFLLQVLFFALFFYVVGTAMAPEPLSEKEHQARDELLRQTKLSDLMELTDLLSKLGPLDQLPGMAAFFQKHGSQKEVEALLRDSAQIKELKENLKIKEQELEGLKTEMKAWGTPSCLYETVAGKVQPKSIAQVRVYDNRIELGVPTVEMQQLLASLGRDFESVQTLSHGAFRATFASLVQQKPNCRYFLQVTARPKLYSSMQVVWSSFRTQ